MICYDIDNFDRFIFCHDINNFFVGTLRIEKPNNWLKRNGYPMRRGKLNRFVKGMQQYYILGVDLNHENYKSN